MHPNKLSVLRATAILTALSSVVFLGLFVASFFWKSIGPSLLWLTMTIGAVGLLGTTLLAIGDQRAIH